MRSRTSFFNQTVFWNDLKRWWPLTAGYTLLWFLILPLTRLTEYGYERPLISGWNMLYDTLGITAVGGYISAFLTAILFAMAAFSYLTSPRATNGLHALPARRETLFVTHYLAGLCSQLVPQLFDVLITMVILGSHGASDLRVTGLMLLTLALPTVFFYSFGVLCMVFTGQILAAPVFYGVLNVLVVGVELLVKVFAGSFLYGWAEPETATLMAFSPIVNLVANGARATSDGGRIYVRGLNWLWLYAAVGVVFAALALVVYLRRHSEATGSIVAIGWARPVFKYGVASCAALALGQLFYYLFFGQHRSNGNYSLAGALLCMAGAGLIGFFAAEMLLKKSFRVWKSGWRGALGVTAALVALGVAMSFDLTGYEGYVPALDKVESVSVDFNTYTANGSCYFHTSDAETIRLVEEAHRAAIADKRFQQSVQRSAWTEDGSDMENVGSFFSVSYHLKNGDLVRRRYSPLILRRSTLGDAGSPAAALTALYNDPTVSLLRALGRQYGGKSEALGLPDLRFTGGYFSEPHWVGGNYLGDTQHDLTPTQAQLLYDAVIRDAKAGHASASLFEDNQEFVTVTLYGTYLDLPNYRGTIEPATEDDGRTAIEFDLTITPRMTEALAVMRAAGIEPSFN